MDVERLINVERLRARLAAKIVERQTPAPRLLGEDTAGVAARRPG